MSHLSKQFSCWWLQACLPCHSGRAEGETFMTLQDLTMPEGLSCEEAGLLFAGCTPVGQIASPDVLSMEIWGMFASDYFNSFWMHEKSSKCGIAPCVLPSLIDQKSLTVWFLSTMVFPDTWFLVLMELTTLLSSGFFPALMTSAWHPITFQFGVQGYSNAFMRRKTL